jgi:hypothetical protein
MAGNESLNDHQSKLDCWMNRLLTNCVVAKIDVKRKKEGMDEPLDLLEEPRRWDTLLSDEVFSPNRQNLPVHKGQFMPAANCGDTRSHRLRRPAVSKRANFCLEIDSFSDLLVNRHAKIVGRLQSDGDCVGDLIVKAPCIGPAVDLYHHA